MKICLIMDNPATLQHPVIGVAWQKLGERHEVRLIDVQSLTEEQAIAQEQTYPQANLYLLKSHARQALGLAHFLEQRGALVVNSWASSLACQDRVLMSQRMEEVHLPWPRTEYFSSIGSLLAQSNLLSRLAFPLMIKSHYSYRGDLVSKISSIEELQSLAPQWGKEPVIIQKFVAGDGWDVKLWVIDQQIFAARRRTPLLANAPKEDIPLEFEELPEDWIRMTLAIGSVFDLCLYGVDLLVSEEGPVIVDVNSFPGFRGVSGASDALVGLIERLCYSEI